uniref:Uncharacterized protein n=1 Tax=Triticum urartu TaxID=4572 RepID=A0A8R7UN54_TRIUA
MFEMIHDMAHLIGNLRDSGGGEDPIHEDVEPGSVDPLLKEKKRDADAFRQFIADDSEELYPGCTQPS